jgi:membrane protease subunit (stomatin/prohibitin family)
MPLLRGMARTAVIAGTATHVSNNVSRRQGERWQRKEEAQYAQEQPQQSAPPQSQAPAPEADPIERLRQLGELHDQGILTDAEFQAQKAKVLG